MTTAFSAINGEGLALFIKAEHSSSARLTSIEVTLQNGSGKPKRIYELNRSFMGSVVVKQGNQQQVFITQALRHVIMTGASWRPPSILLAPEEKRTYHVAISDLVSLSDGKAFDESVDLNDLMQLWVCERADGGRRSNIIKIGAPF